MQPSSVLVSNCRFDHSCKLCVSSCKSPVNFRPVSTACGPTETALAAASPAEHRQLEQRIRTDRFRHGCIWNAVEAYHLHKNQGQFPKNYNFFSVVLSLVNFFGNKDKPGIDSKTENQQCRWWYICLSFAFPMVLPICFYFGWAEGYVRVRVCLFVSLLKATNHNWFKNAWNFPNWLYFYVIQCSGLTQYIHAIAVGVIPRCMCLSL